MRIFFLSFFKVKILIFVWSKKVKKLLLLPFLCTHFAFASECAPDDLKALEQLQTQLATLCTTFDFSTLPKEFQNENFQKLPENCKILSEKKITPESCAQLKAEIEKQSAQIAEQLKPFLEQIQPLLNEQKQNQSK